MELGRGSLRRTKLNTLRQAVHPVYGLVWTDGSAVHLKPFTCFDSNLSYEDSVTLGEFDGGIVGAAWSADSENYLCYLAVQFDDKIKIWSVAGCVPDVELKVVQEIEKTAVAQGLLWHPSLPILCVISKSSVDIVRINKPEMLTVYKGNEITGGMWLQNCRTLILSEGATLQIIELKNMQTSLEEFENYAWQIPSINGGISAMTGMDFQRILVASSLPLLDKVLHTTDDMFEVLGDFDTAMKSPEGEQTGSSMEAEQSKSSNGMETVGAAANIDHGNQDSSKLLMISIKDREIEDREIEVIDSISVSGLLEPDLLSYQSCTKTVALSSTAQSKIQIFSIGQRGLKKKEDFDVGGDKRPKGFCSTMDGKDLLLMVGKVTTISGAAFIPRGLTDAYDLSLRCIPLDIVQTPLILDAPGQGDLFPKGQIHLPRGGSAGLIHQCDEIDAGLIKRTRTYPTLDKAEKVEFIHFRGDKLIRKSFVLINGLLKLETLKEAFQLTFIELSVGTTKLVLSADNFGYIPLTFAPDTRMSITGRRIPDLGQSDEV
ncbi:WD repeat and coiled-coil-containing protein-like [Glandiceps talaboti]